MEKLNEILHFSIFKYEDFNLTVYKLLIASILLTSFLGLIRFIRILFRRLEKKGVFDYGTSNSIFQIVKYVLWCIAIILSLESIGVKVSILLASAAALLVGVGLGLQQLFNDLASGIIILVEQNLKVGDVMQLDDGTVGRVVKIGLRTSHLKTRDDIMMIVPNSKFVNGNVINWSHIDKKTRFKIDVGVQYGSDVQLVKTLLLKCANEHQYICKTPSAFVRFANFGESSLDFELFFWTEENFKVENIKSDLRFAIDNIFRENNITIPFPQRDIHIKKD